MRSLWDVLVIVHLLSMKNWFEYLDTDGVWDDKLPSLKTTRDKNRFRILHIPSWKSLFLHHTSRYSDPNDSIASNVLYVKVTEKINNYDN